MLPSITRPRVFRGIVQPLTWSTHGKCRVDTRDGCVFADITQRADGRWRWDVVYPARALAWSEWDAAEHRARRSGWLDLPPTGSVVVSSPRTYANALTARLYCEEAVRDALVEIAFRRARRA